MGSLKRVLLTGVATVLLATACASVSPATTVPPVNIPSIPPINFSIPPINIPSIPVIGLPGSSNGLQIPGLSIPPGAVPCSLVTAAEVAQIWGSQSIADQSDAATVCTFLVTLTSGVTVEATSDTDLATSTSLFGDTAQSTIGGFPAVTGTLFGQPAVYVQKPSGQVQVIGLLVGTDPSTVTKLQQIAAIAVQRMP
jgi:hypothetical protein